MDDEYSSHHDNYNKLPYLRRAARVTPRPAVKLSKFFYNGSGLAKKTVVRVIKQAVKLLKEVIIMIRVSDNTFEDYPSEMKFVLKLTENVW